MKSNYLSNTVSAQCERILHWLQEKPISTVEARKDLDVLMPAARIFELRQLGHNIITNRRNEITSEGNIHNVAYYVLLSGSYKKEGNLNE